MRSFFLQMLGFSVTLSMASAAEEVKLTSAVIHLLSADYKPVSKIEEIAEPIRQSIIKMEPGSRIANPGEPFDPTCAGPSGLPHLRLSAAGFSGSRWFVCIEAGGIGGQFTELFLLSTRENGVSLDFGGSFGAAVRTIDEVRKQFAQKAVRDYTESYQSNEALKKVFTAAPSK